MPWTRPGGARILLCMALRTATVTDWAARFDLVGHEDALSAPEWDELGQAAWFLGRDADSVRAWERAQLRYLDDGDPGGAVRCAFWIGFTLGEQGETVRARTWMAHMLSLCERFAGDDRADAFAALSGAHGAFLAGEAGAAVELYRAARARAGATEPDIEVLALMGEGRSLLTTGRVAEGIRCMDESCC